MFERFFVLLVGESGRVDIWGIRDDGDREESENEWENKGDGELVDVRSKYGGEDCWEWGRGREGDRVWEW